MLSQPLDLSFCYGFRFWECHFFSEQDRQPIGTTLIWIVRASGAPTVSEGRYDPLIYGSSSDFLQESAAS